MHPTSNHVTWAERTVLATLFATLSGLAYNRLIPW